MKTYMAKNNEVEQKWLVVDADGLILGRMAARVATILMGKNKPTYTPHADVGDYVIVVNAEKVRVTGKKPEQRLYDWYTRYPGGHKFASLAEVMEKKPKKVIEFAVRHMLPKTKMGKKLFGKLKVYVGPNHDHHAQKPEKLQLS